MRVGFLGRTKSLLDTIVRIRELGHTVSFICTCKEEDYYDFPATNFSDYAQAHSIPFFEGLDLARYSQQIINLNPQVCLSINWKTLIAQSFLDIFPFGVLNAHGGDLPRYRGNACINWAILNGEDKASLCIHKMSVNLDDGPIYKKIDFPLSEYTYVGQFYEWLEQNIPNLFAESVDMITKGLPPVPQGSNIVALRCFPRRPEDARINWTSNIKEIHALVRASSTPFPGAFCYTDNHQKVSIFRTRIVSTDYNFNAIPGQICQISPSKLPLIACRENNSLLALIQYQVEDYSQDISESIICSSLRNRLH